MSKLFFIVLTGLLISCTPTETNGPLENTSPVDRCKTDNGGCGDENVFRCEDTGATQVQCHYNHQSDWETLTENIEAIDNGDSWPSTIVIHGDTAFPVVSFTESQRAFIAAARVGDGKVMHWAHESYFYGTSERTDDAGQLLLNAIAWMSPKSQPVIGLGPNLNSLATFLGNHNFPVVDISLSSLEAVDILIQETYDEITVEETAALQDFVRQGKGLITAGLAWWWAYENQNVADKYPGNQMLRDTGLTIAGDWGAPGEHQVADESPSVLENASHALTEILEHLPNDSLTSEQVGIAAATVAHAAAHLSFSFENFFANAETYVDNVDFETITPQQPLVPAEEPLRMLSARIEGKFAKERPIIELDAHPSADIFPGNLPDNATTVSHTQTINATYAGRSSLYLYSNPAAPRWESTGYYAAPGTSVFVTLPTEALGHGLDIQIGSHSDLLWAKESIERFPDIVRTFEITETTTEIKSAFGGLVYIRIPAGTELGTLTVSLDGGYLAPTYFDGVTSVADWQSTVRNYPGPWAELVSDKFVLTVPGTLAQTMDNPDELMAFWNDALDAAADLESVSRARPRAERFVLDEQISLGWMHSGYPLMAFIEASPEFVDLDYIFENRIWGPFHEIGHNHQWEPWLLPGTTETSCNLWSTYMTEEILQMSLDEDERLAGPARHERITEYMAGGLDFYNDWNVWVALDTYLQLKERFGWDFYKTIFANYLALSEAALPLTDQARIDLWVIQSSEVAQHDLSDFYLAWGFPITQNALDAVAHLPDWSDHPMLAY